MEKKEMDTDGKEVGSAASIEAAADKYRSFLHDAFRSAFPRGFAWEVIAVYSGPPIVTFKFRHWGYFEGPYKGRAPTGEKAEFYGIGVMKVGESLRAEDVEIYYDPAELFGGLLKGSTLSIKKDGDKSQTSSCPLYM